MNNPLSNDFQTLIIKKESEFIDYFSLEGKKEISISSDSDFNYLVVSESPDIEITISTQGTNIKSKIFGIFYSNDEKHTKSKIQVNLQDDETQADIYLLSITKENQTISVDGSINIPKGVKKVSGTLLEENLVFGNNVSIKTKPVLNIYSSDVQVSHGAKIEKIEGEKMFYLSSKGISGPSAENLILEGHIDYILDHFKSIDKDLLKAKVIQK